MKKVISILMVLCMVIGLNAVAADKINPDLDWVYEVVSESINGKQYTIPAVNINSEDAKKMNEEFIENYNNLKDSPRIMNLTYDTYQYEDFLIIFTITSLSNGNQYFKPYIINTNTGNRVFGYDIISMSGLPEDNFVEMLDEIISDKLYEKLDEEVYDTFFVTTEGKDNFVNDTIDNINLQDDIYISEDGNIIIATYIQPEDGTMKIFCPIETNISLGNNYENNSLISVYINGDELEFDQPPVIIDGRTLVPLRAIFEALGATVEWSDENKTVTAAKGNTSVKIAIGDNKLYVNDDIVELDVPAQIINERTLVPVRAISEAFGSTVEWDGDSRTVNIEYNDSGNDATIDYTKYVGAYKRLGGTLGFNWILSIEHIDGDNLTYTYTYEKPGSDVIVDYASFIDTFTAVGVHDEKEYKFTFKDDRIILDISDLSDENNSYTQVFNLN